MTETPDTAQSTGTPAPAPAPVPRAILAVPLPDRGWAGRILTHAPGPAETVKLLHEILTTRHKGRDRASEAISELIYGHPAGWEYLGTEPGTEAARTRQREVPLGRCRCHQPDGTGRPGLLTAAQRALTNAEWGKGSSYRPDPGPGTDGAPWLITDRWTMDEDIAHVFLLHPDRIEVYARDQSAPDHYTEVGIIRGFTPAARVPASRQHDWEQTGPALDQASATIRARPRHDWQRAAAARALAEAAKRLERISPHTDLVLYVLGGSRTDQGEANPIAVAALAAAANVHGGDLPALLLRTDRAEQLRVLKLAAHQLDPDTHHAP